MSDARNSICSNTLWVNCVNGREQDDNDDAVTNLQEMLQKLQADVDGHTKAIAQLFDDLIGQRSEVEVLFRQSFSRNARHW